MLDQQFFGDRNFKKFLEKTFVLVRAVRGEDIGNAIYKEYAIMATPTVLITDVDGAEIDRLVGYSPPAESFLEKIKKAYQSEDTYKNLMTAYKKNPDDLKVTFKLARKYDRMYIPAKTAEFYGKVLARADEAKKLEIPMEGGKDGETINLFEYTTYLSARSGLYRKGPAKMVAFLKDFPASVKQKEAREAIAGYARNARGVKPEDLKSFWDDTLEKYPDNETILYGFMAFAAAKKIDVERALEAAEKLSVLKRRNLPVYMQKTYADLLALNDDDDKVNTEFGHKYIKRKVLSYAYDLRTYVEFWTAKKENLESAIEMGKLALALSPDNVAIMQTVAKAYLANDDPAGAAEMYGENYIKDHYDNAGTLNGYAWFWAELGENLESAAMASKKSIELQPSHFYYDTLSMIYWKQKKYKEAIAQEEEALKLAPNNKGYLKRIEDIKKDMNSSGN